MANTFTLNIDGNLTAAALTQPALITEIATKIQLITVAGTKTLADLMVAGVTTNATTFDTTTNTFTIAGVGTVKLTGGLVAGTTAEFTADASLTSSVALTGDNSNSKWLKAATNATGLTLTADHGTITGGAGNDTLTLSTSTITGVAFVDGGAGNDTLLSNATVVGSTATLHGGAGTDTFISSTVADAVAATVDDYKYTDGDVIKSAATVALAATAVNNAGTVTLEVADKLAVSALTAGTDDVFKLKVTNSAATPATTEFWTANITATNINASAVTNAVVATGDAATTTISTGTGNDTITASANGSAIWAGAGNDKIITTATKRDTLWVGKSDGNDTYNTVADLNGTFAATDDVLYLYDGTAADVTLSGADIKYGATTLTSAAKTDDINNILIKGKTDAVAKKVSYDNKLAGAGTFAVASAASAADVFYGNNSTVDYTLYNQDGLLVDLRNTDKYKSIKAITASKTNTGAYIGAANAATTINASLAKKDTAIWGGSANADTIILEATGVKDTVWYGTTDGNDTVSAFEAGFGTTSDVVKLWNTSAITIDTAALASNVATATTGNFALTVGNSSLALTGLTAATGYSADLKLEQTDGTVKKVAFGYDTGNQSTIVADGANFVIGDASGNDVATYAKAQGDSVANWINLQDATKYKNIANVTLGVISTGNDTIVGTTGKNTIDMAAVTGGNTAVWGAAGNDTIKLSASNDVIWFGAGDGNDTIDATAAAVSTSDTIKFYDKSVSQIAQAYSFDSTGKILSNGTDSMNFTVAAVAGVTVADNAGVTTKAAVTSTNAATYATDTKLYFGTAGAAVTNTLNVSTATAVTIDLDNGKNGVSFGDTYFSNFSAISGAGSTGKLTLVGSATKSNALTAGDGGSDIWGGGIGADTLKGGTAGAGVDTFWFGKNDGNDKVQQASAEDVVYLYDTTSVANLTTVANGTDLVITAGSSTLTVAGGTTAGLTFKDANSVSYAYNATTGKLAAK